MPLAGRRPVPLEDLLAPRRNAAPRLSPDGRRVAFVRTSDDRSELWLWSRERRHAHRLSGQEREAVTGIRWTADGAWVLFLHAPQGREAWRLAAAHPDTGQVHDLLSERPIPVTGSWTGRHRPGSVACSARDGGDAPGLYRIDLLDLPPGGGACGMSGPVRRLAANPGFHEWLVDEELTPRGGLGISADGTVEVVLGVPPEPARTVLRVPPDEAVDLAVEGFSLDGRMLWLLTSAGGPTRRLLEIDTSDGSSRTRFGDPRFDLGTHPVAGQGVWRDPRTGLPDLYGIVPDRVAYRTASAGVRRSLDVVRAVARGDPVVIDRDATDTWWLVEYVRDDSPLPYYLVHTGTGEAHLLFVSRPELRGRRLAVLQPFACSARDGVELRGYHTRPAGPVDRPPSGTKPRIQQAGRPPEPQVVMRPADGPKDGPKDGPYPTVVMVHGGPAERELWRFNPEAQFLTDRGYACLIVNFRGSTGYGLDFRCAGHGEWGGRMQEDLYDAVAWGVDAGLVDPSRVALLGASYGGYAALYGARTRPDLFRCAVAISPLCDLVALATRSDAYWRPLRALIRHQLTGSATPDAATIGRLRARSPAHLLHGWTTPLLVAHGARDRRVPVAGVDGFVAAARAGGVPVSYHRFDDEGHHIRKTANIRRLYTAVERFLHQHLGQGTLGQASGAPATSPPPTAQEDIDEQRRHVPSPAAVPPK